VPLPKLTSDRVPRFILLLVAIIAELMLAPLFSWSVFGLDAARVVTSIVLLAALLAVGVRPITLLLFLPAVALHLLGAYWGGTAIHAEALTLRIPTSHPNGRVPEVWRRPRPSSASSTSQSPSPGWLACTSRSAADAR